MARRRTGGSILTVWHAGADGGAALVEESVQAHSRADRVVVAALRADHQRFLELRLVKDGAATGASGVAGAM